MNAQRWIFGAATAVLLAASGPAGAAEVEQAVCLKARNGKFLDLSSDASAILSGTDSCSGSAVLAMLDLNGGALTGADKVYIGSAGLATRWGTDGGSGAIRHGKKGYQGGTESFNIHRKDRKKLPIASGDAVHLNAYTGKWVGGGGSLRATSGSVGAEETFTLYFASKAAADAAVRAKKAASNGKSDGETFHKICLLTRNGDFVTFTSGAPKVSTELKSCSGDAVLTWRDPKGGTLNGQDPFYFYDAKGKNTWLQNMNVHRKDRSKAAVKSGDKIHINAKGGKWVNDKGGNGPLTASSAAAGAGETFTLLYAPVAATSGADDANRNANSSAGKAAPQAKELPAATGDTLKYGDTVVIRRGDRFLSADRWGQASLGNKGDTAFVLLDENGKSTGKPVKLWENPVTLRVANSHRWLQSSKDDDTGLIYRFADIYEVYNFNQGEAGSNKGVNDVVIYRPKLPRGWVFIGDAVFRYKSSGDEKKTRLNQKIMIFKDHSKAFLKPPEWDMVWADGNGPIPPGRRAIVRARRIGDYEWVGGTFYMPWKSPSKLGQARLIHKKYAMWLPLPQFFNTGYTQWSERYQKYTRSGTAMVYNAAAFVDLPGERKLPLMWAHPWGFDFNSPSSWKGGGGAPGWVGNPGFLNWRFLKEFSYYAERHRLRSRPGSGDTGDSPGDPAHARFKLIHADVKKWASTVPVLNGDAVKISHVQSGNCSREACSLHPYDDKNVHQVRTDIPYTKAETWTLTRIDPKKVAARRIAYRLPDGRAGESGGGGKSVTRSTFALVNNWRPYGNVYQAPDLYQSGKLVYLQGVPVPGGSGQIAQLPPGKRPKGTLIFNGNNHDRQARVDVHPDGRVVWNTGGGGYAGYISLSNINFSVRGGRDLPLANGWRNFGDGYAPARVDKIGNTVILSGMIKQGRYGHVATLPSGYRPPGRLIFSVNSHDKQARIDVLPDGRVEWIAGGRDYGWISLSGIIFSVRPDRSLPLSGGWKAFGGDYRLPEITKVGSTVILSGMIKGPNTRATIVGQLPGGYRPKGRLMFNANGHDTTARVDVTADGKVRVETGGTQYGWVTLSGIVFSIR